MLSEVELRELRTRLETTYQRAQELVQRLRDKRVPVKPANAARLQMLIATLDAWIPMTYHVLQDVDELREMPKGQVTVTRWLDGADGFIEDAYRSCERRIVGPDGRLA